MRDPYEGVSPEGLVVTGARHDRVQAEFEPVLSYAARRLQRGVSLYLYGSVATGRARVPASDVDLLTVGVARKAAAELGREASARFGELCRAVEIATAQPGDLAGESDEAYGNRVFVRHYCVHLVGPDPASRLPAARADARAARGFNGDIGRHLVRWRNQVGDRSPGELGRVVARKTLLAVAGLVSVHDHTWTTDRQCAAARWAEIRPDLAASLRRLLAWTDAATASPIEVAEVLGRWGVVECVVDSFATEIGLWPGG